MVDVTAAVALVVAAVALNVAAAQLAQQVLATAYVIRKWRPDHHQRARSRMQAPMAVAPISFYGQDFVASGSSGPDALYSREESGDRIPDDLTVAPTRVDALTVLLTSVAMGVQVYKYSPTAGEVSLAGHAGSISSSVHPALGGLIHYSASRNDLPPENITICCNGQALRTHGPVWAYVVFGRFRIQSSRQEFFPFAEFREGYELVLAQNGWPIDSYSDTISGAACFMTFAHVDFCKSGAPSPVKRWCPHFAEVIVAVHLDKVYTRLKDKKASPLEHSPDFVTSRDHLLEGRGFSSPYLHSETSLAPVWAQRSVP